MVSQLSGQSCYACATTKRRNLFPGLLALPLIRGVWSNCNAKVLHGIHAMVSN